MYGVTALGELLVDFTPSGYSDKGYVLFETNPGGAPANVLAALSKLNIKTSFIGKVGNDQFGYFLKAQLKENNIDTSNLLFSEKFNTTLAFVHLDQTGDRSFHFYREPGADIKLMKEEINEEVIQLSKIFHFGSLSMTHEPAATATFTAIDYAKKHNLMISYDPNLRIPLWDSLDHAKEMIKKGLKYADIVKLSEEELEFLTGYDDVEKGSEVIKKQYDCSLVFVTLGSKGCFYQSKNGSGKTEGFNVDVVDTTGAGDAFVGGALYKILESNKHINGFSKGELDAVAIFANAVGAFATVSKGGIPSMPTMEQIEKLLNS
jgi:fructokinase